MVGTLRGNRRRLPLRSPGQGVRLDRNRGAVGTEDGVADRFGAFYCVQADDLIGDALRTEETRGLPLYLVYSVDVWDGKSYTTDERAAIAAKGFTLPATIATGQPLFVTLTELEQ